MMTHERHIRLNGISFLLRAGMKCYKGTACLCAAVVLCISVISCTHQREIDRVLEQAGENRAELEKILEHYKQLDDAEKLKAAEFLILGMEEHYHYEGVAIDSFATEAAKIENPRRNKQAIPDLWAKYSNFYPSVAKKNDLQTLSADILISNIDQAFNTWQSVAWHDAISFDHFCNYILPYQLMNEPACLSWRDSIKREYQDSLRGITSVVEAYDKMHRLLLLQFRNGQDGCPYDLDAVSGAKVRYGECRQRTLFEGSVMRTLGIPVTLDFVSGFANYSLSKMHSWVSLIDGDTVYAYDSYGNLQSNPAGVNAIINKPSDIKTDDYPIRIDSIKRVSKIWRKDYYSPCKKDVSDIYGYTSCIERRVIAKTPDIALCTFATGADWTVVDWGKAKRGRVKFRNVGHGITYQLMENVNGDMQLLGYPFTLTTEDQIIDHIPNVDSCESIRLIRKYPLLPKWKASWDAMVGSRLVSFSSKDTLVYDTVLKTPTYRNEMTVHSPKPIKEICFMWNPPCRTFMSEIEVYSDTTLLQGEVICRDYKNLASATLTFDGDKETCGRTGREAYWVGLRFEHPQQVTKVIFYPANDGNFIQRGHQYELHYLSNDGRHSLGKQTALHDTLFYNNVPQGALLLLKDLTKGREERIFTYENDKQIWW